MGLQSVEDIFHHIRQLRLPGTPSPDVGVFRSRIRIRTNETIQGRTVSIEGMISSQSDGMRNRRWFVTGQPTFPLVLVRYICSFSNAAFPLIDIAQGHHSCIGQFLASDHMRLVTSRLVKKYHIRFAPDETGDRVVNEMRDQFTTNPGRLWLVFELRER